MLIGRQLLLAAWLACACACGHATNDDDSLAPLMADAALSLTNRASSGPRTPHLPGGPAAFWRFDDCESKGSELSDAVSGGHNALAEPAVHCSEGVQGRAAQLDAESGLLYVSSASDFSYDAGVTFATWVNPSQTSGVHTIARQRRGLDSAFALLIHDGEYQFIVRLETGQLVSVSAPAQADTWTHVAAIYDLSRLRLYVDGHVASQTAVPGKIAAADGPLLLGTDGSGRSLMGSLDDTWLDVGAVSDDTIAQASCVHRAPEVTLTVAPDAPVPLGTTVTYNLDLANNNTPSCAPETLYMSVGGEVDGARLTAMPDSSSQVLESGQRVTVAVEVSSSLDADVRSGAISFFVRAARRDDLPPIEAIAGAPNDGARSVTVEATYQIADPEGCFVSPQRELLITHPSVVDDPERTRADAGAWTFGYLMQQLSSKPAEAAEALFSSFAVDQMINGFYVPARELTHRVVLDPWPRTDDGKLDLTRAPLRLLAIAHRLDLANDAVARAGEGRLVFSVTSDADPRLLFSVAFEYALLADDGDWTRDVHALQALPFPSEDYNRALEALTRRYLTRKAFLRVRTDENVLARNGSWELREFHLTGDSGVLEPAGLMQTPNRTFTGTQALTDFIDQNEASILSASHEVPAQFEGEPFQAGAVINSPDHWEAPNVKNPEALVQFSLNTCDGCHGFSTNTAFMHIFPRRSGEESELSRFLTGSELNRRRQLLEKLVCANAR